MKGKLVLPAVLLTLLLVGVVRAQTGGNYDLSWNAVSAGGGQSGSGSFSLGATAGQAAPGLSSGGNYTLCAGFWCWKEDGVSGGCYLPVVLKNFGSSFCDPYEPNNSRSAPWGPWPSDQTINASICQGDPRDIYYFNASGPVQVTINLTNMPGNVNFDLYLWDETGSNPLAESRHGAGQNEQIVYTLPEAGKYYADVYPWSGTGSYTLQGSGW